MNYTKRVGRGLVGLFLVGFLLLTLSHSALAQVAGSMTGRIEDASGSSVPNATVSVTNLETGAIRTVTAEDSGEYRVLSLPVGRYEVKAEKTGFKTAVQTGISLAVAQQVVVNLTLEVGQVQQQVTVTSEAPVVNTTTASTSGLVGEKEVKDLPLNGRSFDQLITLNAGAANVTGLKGYQVGAGGAGANQGQMFSVSGHRYSENIFLLNGVEYAGPSQNHSVPGGVSGQLLGVDAVREFNVESDTYGAQYGKRAGAQISIVTMSGTNQLHGTVFEFLRNSALDARNTYDVGYQIGQGRLPPFKRNQFGGALGGPIRKDKTFVFGNYEGFRQRLGVSSVSTLPDLCTRAGLNAPAGTNPTQWTLGQCLGPVAAALPAMQTILDGYWPVANGPEDGGGTAEGDFSPPQSIQEDFGTVRVDHNFSTKDTIGLNYLVDQGESSTPQANPAWKQVFDIRSQVLSLQETHLFSPNVINTATIGYSRAANSFDSLPYVATPASLNFLINQFSRPGVIRVSAGNVTQGGGSTATRIEAARNLFTYADELQVIRGRHQWSFGVNMQQLGTNELAPVSQGGSATFASLTALLQGNVNPFTVAPIQTKLHWRQFEGAWFVQDTIQVRHNLTVRLGLRHEFTNGWNEANNMSSNFDFGPNGVLLTAPVQGKSPFTENNSKWLFGPRVGVAWDVFGKGKTSVRAGFGTYYSIVDVLGASFLDRTAPTNGVVSFISSNFPSLVPVNSSTPLPPVCGPGVVGTCTTFSPIGVQQNLKIPTVEQWNMAIEQQITPNMSFRIGYVGSHGYHNETAGDPNQIASQFCTLAAGCASGGNATILTPPGKLPVGHVNMGDLYVPISATLPNPFLAVGSMLFDNSDSHYNGLSLEVARRFNAGLQFKAAYTWSKDLDTATGLTGGGDGGGQPLFDTGHPSLNFGPANHNLPRKFVFSGGYELPFGKSKPWMSGVTGVTDKLVSGWKVNTIITAESGLPFTPGSGSNRSGNGESGGGNPPNWNPSFTGPVILHSPTQWFDPHAFSLPAVGTFGNVQRDALIGPALANVDVSFFKTTAITERVSAQFRAEAFNVLNHANYGPPTTAVFTSSGAISSNVGKIQSAATSRQIQFGLKLTF